MIYTFCCEGALVEHELEAKLDIWRGDPGDRWTPPSGPEIEIDTVKVDKPCDDGSRPYYYRCLIYMLRRRKDGKMIKRLLPAQVADEVDDYLHENREDDILEQASEDYEDDKACAMEDEREHARECREDR